MGGTVVCGVNDSGADREVAELAAALGGRLGLRLVLVHVVDGIASIAPESVTGRQRQIGAERMLDEVSREVGGAETRVVIGHRGDALAAVAAEEGADLIVVGSSTAGLRGKLLRSEIARELESATTVPVLVAPPSTRTRSGRRLATEYELASGA
ncbi:MAG TPA: universal stress protein [Gaiellaceae bacterium]|nr:universal stress protein [Gaiellaceae bacterium]